MATSSNYVWYPEFADAGFVWQNGCTQCKFTVHGYLPAKATKSNHITFINRHVDPSNFPTVGPYYLKDFPARAVVFGIELRNRATFLSDDWTQGNTVTKIYVDEMTADYFHIEAFMNATHRTIHYIDSSNDVYHVETPAFHFELNNLNIWSYDGGEGAWFDDLRLENLATGEVMLNIDAQSYSDCSGILGGDHGFIPWNPSGPNTLVNCAIQPLPNGFYSPYSIPSSTIGEFADAIANDDKFVDDSRTVSEAVVAVKQLKGSLQTSVQALIADASTPAQKRTARNNAVKMMFDGDNTVAFVRVSTTSFGLEDIVTGKSNIVIVKSGNTFDLAALQSDEGFHSELENGDHVIFTLSAGDVTFTRTDHRNSERYYVTMLNWASHSISMDTGGSNFDVNNPSSASNYLVIADAINIDGEVFTIGSVTGGKGGGGGGSGDPHLMFAHGGSADFRGEHNVYYCMHTSPGFQFAAKSVNTSFLLPRPQLVHGTFFTDVAFTIRGYSGMEYGVHISADTVRFDVYELKNTNTLIAERVGMWKQWWEDGIRVYTKQSTSYIRAHGWEVNATRHPIYNYVSGSSRWRLDFSMRCLNGTGFERFHGNASGTCYSHGIIGQSYDADAVGISGALDDYTYNVSEPIVTTHTMAEGAIEGFGWEYALKGPFSTNFRYARYNRYMNDTCLPRDVRKLSGARNRGDGHVGTRE